MPKHKGLERFTPSIWELIQFNYDNEEKIILSAVWYASWEHETKMWVDSVMNYS